MKYKLQGSGVFDTETNQSIPADASNRHYIEYLEWLDAGFTPDPEFSLDDNNTKRINEIKAAAGDKIVSLVPEWKQRNKLAEAVEILMDSLILSNPVVAETLTPTQIAAITEMQQVWDGIKHIRALSDSAEITGKEANEIDW